MRARAGTQGFLTTLPETRPALQGLTKTQTVPTKMNVKTGLCGSDLGGWRGWCGPTGIYTPLAVAGGYYPPVFSPLLKSMPVANEL
jgi:hypothetical protein